MNTKKDQNRSKWLVYIGKSENNIWMISRNLHVFHQEPKPPESPKGLGALGGCIVQEDGSIHIQNTQMYTHPLHVGVSIVMGVPLNGLFIMENPI